MGSSKLLMRSMVRAMFCSLELASRHFKRVEPVTRFGLTPASCTSVTMPQTYARPCALPLSFIVLMSSLKFTRVGCRHSFFISSINAHS